MKTTTPVSFNFLPMLVVLAVGVGTDTCLAGSIRHDKKAEDYRALGRMKDFACVVQIGVKPLGRPQILIGGNGVLIAPQWILTAGHVVAAKPLKRLRFQFGGEIYRAKRLVLHPDFPPDRKSPETRLKAHSDGVDLALIELDRRVVNVPPASLYRGEHEVGKTVSIVGDGATADGKAGLTVPITLERRGFHNTIDAAGGNLGDVKLTDRVLLFDFDAPDNAAGNQLGDAKSLDMEGGITKGDSGGGWFIKVDGKWQLVAITSRRLPPSGNFDDATARKADLYYGAIGVGTRVSTANDWIDEVLDR